MGQLQIVQDARDHLTIRVNKGAHNASKGITEADKQHVETLIGQLFHGAMRVSFQQVDSIPPEKSGKYRACINQYLASESQSLGLLATKMIKDALKP